MNTLSENSNSLGLVPILWEKENVDLFAVKPLEEQRCRRTAKQVMLMTCAEAFRPRGKEQVYPSCLALVYGQKAVGKERRKDIRIPAEEISGLGSERHVTKDGTSRRSSTIVNRSSNWSNAIDPTRGGSMVVGSEVVPCS